jgi:hypothetical protein
MPLQNRVAPDGSLHAVPDRGLLMGNRGGRIHGAGALGRARWRSRAWICCVTEFRNRHREVWGAGYTELFFLDEATALAAGHRPCFECRRADALAFAAAWARAHGTPPPRAPAMDRALHAERLAPPGLFRFADLPEGAMFAADGAFHLRLWNRALAWSFAGYRPARAFAPAEPVAALTPTSIRAALGAGYRPRLHPSADQRSAR